MWSRLGFSAMSSGDSDVTHPWKRFWVPSDGVVRLTPEGYLADPEGEHGRLYNPDLVTFDVIAEIPCLALLGEPGAGKTTILNSIVEDRKRCPSVGPAHVLHVDLRSYGDESRLHRDIFESPQFLDWINSTDVLEIFLDSLDECLAYTRTVAALLVDQFKRYPVNRLRLRIACRAADWPALLARELPSIWGPENFAAYELARLRRVDIGDFVDAIGLAPDPFLREIEHLDVVPLATVPMTLQLLLSMFRQGGRLPGTRVDLYEKGCLALCCEDSLSRRAGGATGSLEPPERLTIAERIAAVTMFSKRPMISLSGEEPQMSDLVATVGELASAPEFIEEKRIDFDSEHVREVLRTGLFELSLSETRRVWRHWTFAEFLAARWAKTRGLTIDQLSNLVFHPGSDGRDQVVPQLHETAAWLAAMVPALMERIVINDPQVLLRSTVAHSDADTKSRIAGSLLRLLDTEKITDTDVELRHRYEVLQHADLPKQLLPYITDRSKNVMARRAAIDIAEACNVTALGDTLANVALERDEAPHIRAQAAHAVARIGDLELKRKLRPLLRTTTEEDPDEEIRGSALDALSDQLTGAEIFACVTSPRRPNLIGAYKYFLEYELPKRLKRADLPAAVAWVADQRREVHQDFALQRLGAVILDRAWSDVDAPGVVPALAKAVIARLQHHDSPFDRHGSDEVRKRVAGQSEARRQVLREIVPRLRGEQHRYTRVGLAHSGLVLSTDIPWLVDELDAADAEDKGSWALLIARAFNPEISGHYDLVIGARERHSALASEVEWWFDTVTLDSPQADKMRADYAEQTRWERREEPPRPKHPPMPKLVTRWLERLESGDINAWWRLNLDLTLTPDADYYGEELQSDLTRLPGWAEIDDPLRERCLAAAERYLHDADPRTAEWLGTNTFHRPALAGYRALRLLMRLKPDTLATLSAADWEKWAPIIVAYPESSGGKEEHAAEQLVALAYQEAPDSVIQTVKTLIDKENSDHGTVFVTRKLTDCWDSRLVSVLLEKVRSDPSLKPPAIRELLSETLSHDGQATLDLALSILKAEKDATDLARRVAAGAALLGTAPSQVWSAVWQLVLTEPDLGRELFLKFAHSPGEALRGGLASHLREDAVADLYLWLAEQFPEEAIHVGAHWIGERESVALFREGLLRHLTEKGTRGAVEAVRRIQTQLGDKLPWLKYIVLRADAARLREEWKGIDPETLFRLARNPEARLVESEDQLADLVYESLNRLQAKLHGTPPAVADLWNDDRPKDEPHLSNYVQRHLREDLGPQRGIVANREVEIRPGPGDRRQRRRDEEGPYRVPPADRNHRSQGMLEPRAED